MWRFRWKEDEVKGSAEDQIKALRSRIRDLRRNYWIMWVCFLLTTTIYHIQYIQVRMGQRQVIAMDQRLSEAAKENQAACERLETVIQGFIETVR